MNSTTLKASLFLIILLSMSMLISGYLTYRNTMQIIGAWESSGTINLYLKMDASEQDKAELIRELTQNINVDRFHFIPRAQANADFKSSLKSLSYDFLQSDDFLDLVPESFELVLKSESTGNDKAAAFSDLKINLSKFAFIDDIEFSQHWFKKIEGFGSFVHSFALISGLLILFSMSYLISMMIHIFISESKSEIEIFSLLGATRWSQYNYFLKKVLYFTLLSSILSHLLVFFITEYIIHKISNLGISPLLAGKIQYLTPAEAITITTLIFVFVFANSFFTVRKQINTFNQILNE